MKAEQLSQAAEIYLRTGQVTGADLKAMGAVPRLNNAELSKIQQRAAVIAFDWLNKVPARQDEYRGEWR